MFSKINLDKLVEYQDIIPKILIPKEIKNILNISYATSYVLVKEAMNTKIFSVIEIYNNYRINKKEFLKWLLGYESNELSDIAFRVFNVSQIKEILQVCEQTVYIILNQATINNWVRLRRLVEVT